jgi:hypothetical protein
MNGVELAGRPFAPSFTTDPISIWELRLPGLVPRMPPANPVPLRLARARVA